MHILNTKKKLKSKNIMELQKCYKLCVDLLKNKFLTEDTVQNNDRFELMVDELLECFPMYKNGDQVALNNLKRKIGKMLSIKARALNVNENSLKKIKSLIFDIVNKKIDTNKQKRKIKIGKNREIYSSEDQSEQLDQEQQFEETEQIQPLTAEEKTNAKNTKGSLKSSIKIQGSGYKKRKYMIYDHDFKQQVCEYAVEHGIQPASKKFKLSIRKLGSWLESHSLDLLGKGRKALDPAMEFNLCVWILKKIWEKIPLTQKIIRHKASLMSTHKRKFNGSKGWLEKFFLRHVQIKSCFDIRSKPELSQQCAKYHKSAFTRLLKDYQSLLKLQLKDYIISGNFQQIIYQKGDSPLLKIPQDVHLDKLKLGEDTLYNYDKLQAMPNPTPVIIKKQQNTDNEYDEQESEPEYQSQQQSQTQSEEQIVHKHPTKSRRKGRMTQVKYEQSYDGQQNLQAHIYQEEEDDGNLQNENSCAGIVKIEEPDLQS